MKKFISLALCAVLILATLTACGTASKTKSTYTIGLCNYVNDASLNQIVENIQSQLAAIGKEKGVTFDVKYQTCNAPAKSDRRNRWNDQNDSDIDRKRACI